MNDEILLNLTCAIIKTAVDDIDRYRRSMARTFKRRHNKKCYNFYKIVNNKRVYVNQSLKVARIDFKLKHDAYKELKNFLYSQNIWFDYLNIDHEYFIKKMEEQLNDNATY